VWPRATLLPPSGILKAESRPLNPASITQDEDARETVNRVDDLAGRTGNPKTKRNQASPHPMHHGAIEPEPKTRRGPTLSSRFAAYSGSAARRAGLALTAGPFER
jgi:hypothetical protein